MAWLALRDHDEAFVQAQLLLQDVDGDCERTLPEHLIVFSFEDYQSTRSECFAVVFSRVLTSFIALSQMGEEIGPL